MFLLGLILMFLLGLYFQATNGCVFRHESDGSRRKILPHNFVFYRNPSVAATRLI